MAITITEYRNVESWNDANTRFDMEINHPLHGWIPFTLDMSDDGTDIDKDALRTLIGTNFTAMSQDKIDRIEGDAVRHQRDTILQYEVDPIIANSLRWAELTTEKQNEWKQYRTDLLNVPQQSGFPHNVTFPTKPS
jgi:hypothetical protein|tara:strand:- start:1106 stop:1513 length:408 start_codon:yes stop_codon:yes gene_type:complete